MIDLASAADVAAAHGQDGGHVVRREVGQELGLVVEHRADPALALGAVATGAVRLEEQGAALDRDHLLGLGLRAEPAGIRDARDAELVEVVADDEDRHDRDGQEGDPARAPALAHDLRGALRRQPDRMRLDGRAEALRRLDFGRLAPGGQALLGAVARLVGHRVPRSTVADSGSAGCGIRCSPSGSARPRGPAGRGPPGAGRG